MNMNKPEHMNAVQSNIAPLVLLAGDPLRAQFLANHYLDNAVLVSDLRGMYFYTGYYHKTRITIGGHGMGCSSMGIYAQELYDYYNVETIIRIGTCGSYEKTIRIHDLINVTGATGENRFGPALLHLKQDEPIMATEEVVQTISEVSKEMHFEINEGLIHSADIFYLETEENWSDRFAKTGVLGVEMEAYALFALAAKYQKQAGCVLTVARNFHTMIEIEPKDRANSLKKMFALSLQVGYNISQSK